MRNDADNADKLTRNEGNTGINTQRTYYKDKTQLKWVGTGKRRKTQGLVNTGNNKGEVGNTRAEQWG